MKKIIICIMFLFVLCSCSRFQDNPSTTVEDSVSETSQSTDTATQMEESSDMEASIDETLMNRLNYLVSENFRCVGEIFYLDMLPTSGSSETLGQIKAAKVNYPKFFTYKDFELYIRDLFSNSYAEKKLKTDKYEGYPQYFEHNGALYENVSMLGGIGYFIDWSNFGIDNVKPDGERCMFDVNVINLEDIPEDYVIEMEAVKENGVWKFVKMFTGD